MFGQGKIIYVDSDAPSSDDGAKWSSAYRCLQNALEIANTGDEIWVAEGTYKPDRRIVDLGGREGLQIIASGDREATFQLINGVTLKGGYAGLGHDDPDTRDIEQYQSILSGDLADDDAMVNTPLEFFLEPRQVLFGHGESCCIFMPPEFAQQIAKIFNLNQSLKKRPDRRV